MDGWNTIVSFWDAMFSGAFAVSFTEGISNFQPPSNMHETLQITEYLPYQLVGEYSPGR